jgi:hypothetical protein
VPNAATQTPGHYHYFSSEPEECFEVDTNEADETDPSWTPYTEKCVDNASPAMSLDFKGNNDKKKYTLASKAFLLLK